MTHPNGPVWSRMVPYGHVCSPMIPYGPLWSRMVTFGTVWSHKIPYDPVYHDNNSIVQGVPKKMRLHFYLIFRFIIEIWPLFFCYIIEILYEIQTTSYV